MSTSQTPPGIDEVMRNIRVEMTRHDITQAQLADLLGISQVAVSKRLRGVVPISVAELLHVAQLLHVTPADLLKDAA
jgi:transcriptional regulator with XRE-family HTH domain